MTASIAKPSGTDVLEELQSVHNFYCLLSYNICLTMATILSKVKGRSHQPKNPQGVQMRVLTALTCWSSVLPNLITWGTHFVLGHSFPHAFLETHVGPFVLSLVDITWTQPDMWSCLYVLQMCHMYLCLYCLYRLYLYLYCINIAAAAQWLWISLWHNQQYMQN